MRKNFNTFIMSHMKLVNFIISSLILTIFLIMVIVVKFPIEHGFQINLMKNIYEWFINQFINDITNLYFLPIISVLGLLVIFITPIITIITIIFGFSKSIKIFSILQIIGILLCSYIFIHRIQEGTISYLLLYTILLIFIIVQLIINLNFNKYRVDKNELNM